MKKLILALIVFGWIFPAHSQEKSYDTTAAVIFDHMSKILGELKSCSFDLKVARDTPDDECGMIAHHEISNISFYGPDKMLMNIRGSKGHRGYWYNGSQLVWYSYDENNYVALEVPDNTIDMIDTVYETYGIEFPAADFFYPGFTDDVIIDYDNIYYKGKTNIEGKDCFHIIAKNKEMVVQFWISDDALFLPYKMLINYYKNSNIGRYEATFYNWHINPELPLTMFEFNPPPLARLVSIVPKKNIR